MKKTKTKSISGAALGFGISTVLLAGTTGWGVYLYDQQVDATEEERSLRLEVEEVNGKLINKIDKYEVDLSKKYEVELQLRNKVESNENKIKSKDEKIKSLENSMKSKDSKIDNLEVELHSKAEKKKQQLTIAKDNSQTSKYKNSKGDGAPIGGGDNNASSSGSNVNSEGNTMTMTTTAYTADCYGCSGVTSTGIDLRNDRNKKVIAVDPNVIPLGTMLHVEGYGTAVAGDIGGAIKGNRLDLHVPTESQANAWGVRTVKVTILD